MAGLDMAKGRPLPGIRADSKDAFGKLKDSEPRSGSIHGDKFSSASDLAPVGLPRQNDASRFGNDRDNMCIAHRFGPKTAGGKGV
jgi:hypothetical protein